MSSIPTIVIYHGNCPDGFAAYSLYRKWALAFGPVTGYPVAPQDERTWPAIPPSPFSVAFLDVVPDEAALLRWEAAAVKTTVIDHHASSKDTLPRKRTKSFSFRPSVAPPFSRTNICTRSCPCPTGSGTWTGSTAGRA